MSQAMASTEIMNHESDNKPVLASVQAWELPVRSRAMDIVFHAFQILLSAAGLIVFSPLFLVVAILVKINSPGPVFYRGARIGKGNTLYKLVKFRTLPVQYEQSVGDRVLTQKERINGLFAAIVVRSKLDELPQLINVIKGDMNFVGPRPVRPIIYSKYSKTIPGYNRKFAVKPGITGLAQIIGGYYMDPRKKHKYDMLYMERRCLLLDMKLIALTFLTLVLSRRIMKLKITERFLGFELGVDEDELEPTADDYKNVTGT